MSKNRIITILIIAVLVLAAIIYWSNRGDVVELESEEVESYEGQDLSSVNDFRENSIKGPQYIDKNSYKLLIKGLHGNDLAYSYEYVVSNSQLYKKVVRLNCVEGWSVDILWEGVLVRDLIDVNNIPSNVNTVIFRAYDGYSTSFPLGYILDNDIIMAYKMNDVVLPPERGFPFQLVAEDKYGYKWIKWITEIEFSDDESYEGYWESRGYSNSGNLNEDFLKK
ncbi:molybdopterin-dependent oxidoreductase [Patescibacteria group bacterium]